MKNVKVLIIGGSGHWSNKTHYQAILELKKQAFPINVLGICDPIDPQTKKDYKYLSEILLVDNPTWMFDENMDSLLQQLSAFHAKHRLDVVIIACNPVLHYFYCNWAADNHVNVICDKPISLMPKSAFDLSMAQKNQPNYEKLVKKFASWNGELITPLRRRNHPVFIESIKRLRKAYELTGEGISYLQIIANNGKCRLPAEFLNSGSHGFIDGVGSSSHTFYHFVDVCSWFLQNAPGRSTKIKVSVPYIFRVKDYIKQKKYLTLQNALVTDERIKEDDIELPDNILNCEYDFNLQLHLLDESNDVVGLMQIFNCHSSYSNRVADYSKDINCPCDYPEGGRMKQFYLDIHQGSIQNIQILRNNDAFETYKAHIFQRANPILNMECFSEKIYDDVDQTVSSCVRELVILAMKKQAGQSLTIEDQEVLSGLHNQSLTQKIFSVCYEMIAYEYASKQSSNPYTEPNPYIELSEYKQESNITLS